MRALPIIWRRTRIADGEGVHAGVLQEHNGRGCGLPRLGAVLSTLRRSAVTGQSKCNNEQTSRESRGGTDHWDQDIGTQ